MVARFLSPDPFISAPGNWDSYNRYGYCFNNPLLFTDPSGNKPFLKWLKENTLDKFWGSLNGTDPDGDGVYTGGLNEKFIKWGIPSFGVNVNYNFTASNPQFKPDGGSRGNFVSGALTYKNVEVFNTENLHQPDYAGIGARIDKAFKISSSFNSWMDKNKDQPVVDLNFTYLRGYGGKWGVEVFGEKLNLGLHIATIERTYNFVTGYKEKVYGGLEAGLGPIGVSFLYEYDNGFLFDYDLSALKNVNSDPRFNIFCLEGYVGIGGKVSLDINPARYIQVFDPTLDYRYLYLYK